MQPVPGSPRPGGVRDVDAADEALVLPQRLDDLALVEVHMVGVVKIFHVGGVHHADDLGGVLLRQQLVQALGFPVPDLQPSRLAAANRSAKGSSL